MCSVQAHWPNTVEVVLLLIKYFGNQLNRHTEKCKCFWEELRHVAKRENWEGFRLVTGHSPDLNPTKHAFQDRRREGELKGETHAKQTTTEKTTVQFGDTSGSPS